MDDLKKGDSTDKLMFRVNAFLHFELIHLGALGFLLMTEPLYVFHDFVVVECSQSTRIINCYRGADMSTRIITCDDENIEAIRNKHPNGLHFVVGDTHGECRTLKVLMEKIVFDPHKDSVFFVGDYNEGGNPRALLDYISCFYQPDYSLPGFHLIRGNHERELFPSYPLENLPDIIIIKGKNMRYYITHAGMVSRAFRLINEDIGRTPERIVHAYRLDDSCAQYDAPFRQIVWSRRGLYSQQSRWRHWPSEEELHKNRACIIHGHSPYCYFVKDYSYGDDNIYWQKQHVFFCEDLQV